jgi:6-phosphofructokinase
MTRNGKTPKKGEQIKRVGIVFSGGPAPAANSVIAAAAISLIDDGREVIGFFHGYSNLEEYHPISHRLLPDTHYRVFEEKDVLGLRNRRGIIIGTARANPCKGVDTKADLRDRKKTAKLRNVYTALIDLQIDALISIGGDDTLKTANLLHMYQDTLPADAPRIKIVHLPKTIDNDYMGIDFTFGFFTSVDVMAKELLNLRADAESSSSWFLVESMGRKAGWLAYGVAIAGEANLVLGTEDLDEEICTPEEVTDPKTGEKSTELKLDVRKLAKKIVDLMVQREQRSNKHHGTIVLAEGLAEHLPSSVIEGIDRDPHGLIPLGKLDLGRMVSEAVKVEYCRRTGRKKKITSVQLGYESRCAAPHAYDVMLGSQLGIGAYRALVEEGLTAHMVSVSGQLDLHYVPFDKLIDKKTLKTTVRFIERGSDFHKLARFLETRSESIADWSPGYREEPIV